MKNAPVNPPKTINKQTRGSGKIPQKMITSRDKAESTKSIRKKAHKFPSRDFESLQQLLFQRKETKVYTPKIATIPINAQKFVKQQNTIADEQTKNSKKAIS
ncbi:hypothetical protein ABPG74_012493 [Tetrahymena malaccensis]